MNKKYLSLGIFSDVIEEQTAEEELESKPKFKAYPNPSDGQVLTVVLSKYQPESRFRLDVVDVSGKLIQSVKLGSEVDYMELFDIQPGMYFLILFEDGLRVESQRLIVK